MSDLQNLLDVEHQEEEMDTVAEEFVAGIDEIGSEFTETMDDGSENSEKGGGSETISKKRRRKGGCPTVTTRSTYWIHFERYICGSDKIQKAKCKYCSTILKADPRKHGTGPLKQHFDRCKAKPKKQLVRQSGGSSKESQTGSWKFDQKTIMEAIRYMILVDELPLRTVEKLGFKFLMAVVCPMFKIPSRRAITKDIYEFYCDEKTRLKSLIKKHNGRISITTDTWTSIQRINYMCLTAHFIDDGWKLQKRILNFCPILGHKSEELGMGIEKCLLDWGIEKIYTVTVDNASSNNGAVSYLKKKFDNWGTNLLGGKHVHMRCIAHIVNLIVQDGLKNKEEHLSTSRIRGAIRYIRNYPARYKKFVDCVELEKCDTKKLLSLDVPTRWNSTYMMLESALCLRRAFEAYEYADAGYKVELSEPPYDGVPMHHDWDRAKLLVTFLAHFYKFTLSISGSLMVTSNQVFHEICALELLLKKCFDSEDSELRMMAKRMKQKFDKYWGEIEKMNMNLYFAVILDPRHKFEFHEFSFDRLYDDDDDNGISKRASIKNKVKNEMQEMFETYKKMYGAPKSPAVCLSSSLSSGTSSAEILLTDQFKQYKSGTRKEHVKTELEKYLSEDYEFENEMGVLEWWRLNSHRFPILSKMARDVLAVPVSTVASESTFSTGGRVLDAFRSSLSTKIVQALIYAQNWIRSESAPIISSEEDLGKLETLEKEFIDMGIDPTLVDVVDIVELLALSFEGGRYCGIVGRCLLKVKDDRGIEIADD